MGTAENEQINKMIAAEEMKLWSMICVGALALTMCFIAINMHFTPDQKSLAGFLTAILALACGLGTLISTVGICFFFGNWRQANIELKKLAIRGLLNHSKGD